MSKVAIIGAGLSGLSAARVLGEEHEVTLFEKARGVSGRMSTRRAEPFYFDHGAQYFTAKSAQFQSFLSPLIDQEVVKPWMARFVEIDGSAVSIRDEWATEYPRYVGVPGMNAIARHLAEGLQIHIQTRIKTMIQDNGWVLHTQEGETFGPYDWVICSAPAEQTAELMPEAFQYLPHVQATKMSACYSLMIGWNDCFDPGFDAARVSGWDISWISLNNSKPGRGDKSALLVHSTNEWAEQHIDEDRRAAQEHLVDQLSEILQQNIAKADHKVLHGWRYANIEPTNSDGLLVDYNSNLAACGDWCVEGRVEAAFTSGLNTAQAINNAPAK